MKDFLGSTHFRLEEASTLFVTIFLCFVVLNSRGSIFNRRARRDMRQTHSFHSVATPRLGGAAIFSAVVLSSVFVDGFFGGRYAKLVLAMLPMISITLWEDMLRATSPQTRLSATLASCFLSVITLQIWFTGLDVSLIDPWMTGVVGVLITVAFVAASVNGFNMVDGMNGLCAGIAIAGLLALHLIASAVGHQFVAQTTLTLAVAVGGFLFFNFPKGRIFLGDTGSYILGYIIVWLGISITYWFDDVSPWAVFLIVAYPLSELALTVLRRLLSGQSPFRPDTRHTHHLVLLLLRLMTSYGKPLPWQNPTATLIILPFALAPMVPAVLFFDSPGILQVLTLSYGVAIACIYVGLVVLTRQLGRKITLDTRLDGRGQGQELMPTAARSNHSNAA